MDKFAEVSLTDVIHVFQRFFVPAMFFLHFRFFFILSTFVIFW